jgi:hypothetical protein
VSEKRHCAGQKRLRATLRSGRGDAPEHLDPVEILKDGVLLVPEHVRKEWLQTIRSSIVTRGSLDVARTGLHPGAVTAKCCCDASRDLKVGGQSQGAGTAAHARPADIFE